MPKSVINLSDVEHAVLTMAAVAFDNEKYFGDLDGEMGDADFGKSLAQGFRAIQAEFDKIDHSDIGALLVKCGMIFAANVGGCSGPIWGTAFMRAGMTAKGKTSLTLADLVAMGRNAVEGMKARGGASAGDKTLLDAVIPAIDKIEEFSKTNPDDVSGALHAASDAATAAIEGNAQLGGKARPRVVCGREDHRNSRSRNCCRGHDGIGHREGVGVCRNTR